MLLIYIYLSINLVYRIRIRIILGFLDPDPEHRLIDMYLETRDPYFYDTDPRIRINIKTMRIRNTEYMYRYSYLSSHIQISRIFKSLIKGWPKKKFLTYQTLKRR